MENQSCFIVLIKTTEGKTFGSYIDSEITGEGKHIGSPKALIFNIVNESVEKYTLMDTKYGIKIYGDKEEDLFSIGKLDILIKKKDKKSRCSCKQTAFNYFSRQNVLVGKKGEFEIKHFIVLSTISSETHQKKIEDEMKRKEKEWEEEKRVQKHIKEVQQKYIDQGLSIENNLTVAAPFKVLVDWAITPENSENDFMKKLMLNYRSYAKPLELFTIIQEIVSETVAASTEENIKETKQKWIKITILMKTWTEIAPLDFHNDELVEVVNQFVEQYEKDFPGIKPIKRFVEHARTNKNGSTFERIPSLETTEKSKVLKELTVEEIVDQLCLFEYNCFSGIPSSDFLGSGWTKQDKYTRCARLMEFMDHFNAVTNWVCSSILEEKDINERAKLIDKCILITDMMRKRVNFTGFFEFYSGLNSSSISRLTKTWDLCKLKEKMDDFGIVALPTKSYMNYRNVLSENAHNQYLIPFMGVIIQDLTFLDEGNPNEIDGKVNFEKCRMMADLLLEIQKYQNVSQSNISILPFFKDFIEMIHQHVNDDDTEMYKLSLELQPRVSSQKLMPSHSVFF